jgi:co-chaperonin GroES (HSP10)
VVGDRVLVTQFAGMMAKGPADGQMYRLVNDRDIFCAITHEESDNG